MKKMQIPLLYLFICFVVCSSIGPARADTKTSDKRRGWFARLEVSEDKLLAAFPQDGLRYHLWINDIDRGVSQYGQVLELSFDDTLRMQDKHFNCVLRAKASPIFTGLVGSCDGNARGEKVFRSVELIADSGEQNQEPHHP